MKMETFSATTTCSKQPGAAERGFSLIELLVSLAIFMLIGGAAFSLFSKQQSSATLLQNQVGLNLALRNAANQMQLDIENAGSGYFQGVNIPTWPVGVTIVNNVPASGTSCYNSTTARYGVNCFDQLNVITAADPATYPPINTTDSTGGNGLGNCSNTNTGIAYGQAASGLTLSQTVAKFKRNDQVLLLNSTGSKLTSVVLTADAVVAGSAVKFVFNSTLDQTVSGVNYKGYNTLANDPLDITACDGITPCSEAAQNPAAPQLPGKLGEQFCGGDWMLKLNPITFQVDTTTDPKNPKLTRTQNGTTSTVMEQVIGFKVGAAIWNQTAATPTDTTQYNYRASTYTNQNSGDMAYNFSLVRAVRISLIGRTAPNQNATYTFRNAFDGGSYQVQGIAIVVNPRNMSMND